VFEVYTLDSENSRTVSQSLVQVVNIFGKMHLKRPILQTFGGKGSRRL